MSFDDFQYRPVNDNKGKTKLSEKALKMLKDIHGKLGHLVGKLGKRFSNPENFKDGKPNLKQILIWIGLAFGALFAAGVIIFTLLIIILSIGLPNVRDLDKLSQSQSTTIYDREGNVLYVKHGAENRQYITYDQISPNIVNAVVSIEDDQYWQHPGFDPAGIVRAFVTDIFHASKSQGGSTITQQYIKHTFLTPEKSYIRKLKELILAVQLEQAYDKKKIMELYLNKIPYGNNAHGVEKASEVYFNKHAKDLDLAEAAVIAAIPQAPTHYNPYGQYKFSILTKQFSPEEITSRNIKSEADLKDPEFIRGLIGKEYKLDDSHSVYVQGRTDLVLKTMEKYGYINAQQKNDALNELQKIEFNTYVESIKAPHFVFYVLDQLEEKYGKEVVEQGGLQVYTTIDPKLQDIAKKAIDEGVDSNTKRFNAKNGALTAIDPKTGQILAMVGSRDYNNKDIDGAVNIATSYKQPGSSFKPLIYAKSFYNRFAPGSVIFDVETRFGASAFPKDFDGKWLGPISIRKALGQSRNIPAIKAYFVGGEQKEIVPFVQRLGINFLDPDQDYGWPMAIGSAEVRQLDLVSAFSVMANGGIRHEPVSILKVLNSKNDVLEEYKETPGEEVLDPQIAYLISDILSDQSVNIGPNLNIAGHKVAVKTGTSNTKSGTKYLPHDLWTIGYTPSIAVAVWTGNTKDSEDNILTYTADGYNASAPIWRNFLTEALKDKPNEDFPVPEGIRHETVSKLTGKLPGPNTPEDQLVTEVFASFSVPTEIDDSYTKLKIDTRNNKLANDFCPELFTKEQTYLNLRDIAPYPNWEEGAQKWLQQHTGENLDNSILGTPPTTESELCTQENMNNKPDLTIISPSSNEQIATGAVIQVQISATSSNSGIEKAEYYLDGQQQYTEKTAPYYGEIRLPKVEIGTNSHIIKVIVYDRYGYTTEKTVTITTSRNTSTSSDTQPIDPATSSVTTQ